MRTSTVYIGSEDRTFEEELGKPSGMACFERENYKQLTPGIQKKSIPNLVFAISRHAPKCTSARERSAPRLPFKRIFTQLQHLRRTMYLGVAKDQADYCRY